MRPSVFGRYGQIFNFCLEIGGLGVFAELKVGAQDRGGRSLGVLVGGSQMIGLARDRPKVDRTTSSTDDGANDLDAVVFNPVAGCAPSTPMNPHSEEKWAPGGGA